MGVRSRLREPLVQFLLLGSALFALDAFWPREDGASIVVTKETVSSLVERREELLMRPLTVDERERLVSDWIDDEVLVREAYRLGLDESDGVIRSRLVEKMRFLLEADPPEPARAQLEELLRAHPERFEIPRTTSFDHVFFSEAEKADPATLDRLRAGADFERLGDEFWLGATIREISDSEISRTFGPNFARELAGLELGLWCGPVRSSRGAHFVRVTNRRVPRLPPFDEISWLVREDWLRRSREAVLEQKLTELRRRYRVRAYDVPRSGQRP